MILTSTSSFLFSIILITFYALRFLRCFCLSTDKASVSDHRGSCTAEFPQNMKFDAQFGYWYHQMHLLTSAPCGIFVGQKHFIWSIFSSLAFFFPQASYLISTLDCLSHHYSVQVSMAAFTGFLPALTLTSLQTWVTPTLQLSHPHNGDHGSSCLR